MLVIKLADKLAEQIRLGRGMDDLSIEPNGNGVYRLVLLNEKLEECAELMSE